MSTQISIAIPAYNAERTLSVTLESLIAQGYACWDASVVDDGSTDGTGQLLEAYATRDSRIHFLTQANAGTGAAMNAAFVNARGEYIAQFGADDELLPDYMDTMAAFMREHPGFDIYSCNAWLQFADGSRVLYSEDADQRPWVTMALEDYLNGYPYLFAGGALIRRQLYEEIGGFRPDYYCEDVDFWGRALAHGARHIYCPEPLVIYNVGNPGQKTTDIAAKCDGTVAVYEDLVASGLLTDEQKRLAEEAITRVNVLKQMELSSRQFRMRVERVFGSRNAERVLQIAHWFTRIVRPFREWLARRRAA